VGFRRRSAEESSQSLHLLGVLAQHDAAEAGEFIPVDFLNRAAAALRAESQDVIEVGMARQGVLEAHRLARRAEIEQRAHAGVAPIRSRPGYSHHLFAVHLVAKEEVAALHFLTDIAQTRGAVYPAFIAEFIHAARA